MILEFFGKQYTGSFLMNLSGFNYGFTYFKGWDTAYSCPATPDGPWEVLVYAADRIGCKSLFVKDKTWDETWKTLKEYIDNDMPVLMVRLDMQYLWKTTMPLCHVVVLCGYDEEKGVVMVNDPALGEFGEGVRYLPPNGLPADKSGSYAEYSIDDFRKALDLEAMPWAFTGKNGYCVISPPEDKPEISWAEVHKRNAEFTIGKIDEAMGRHIETGNIFGPEGIIELAALVKDGLGLKNSLEIIDRLASLRMLCFQAGNAYKTDASAFVAGIAATTGNRELEKAAYSLKAAAVCFEQGVAEIDHLLSVQSNPGDVLKQKLVRLPELLKRAAGHERQTGDSLSKAAQALG